MVIAKTIMIQGTASGVGKSTIVAGLCRLLVQKGYRVAPFKALNTSDNSYVFPNGQQIACSQAIQAQACKIQPSTDMNPIMIKPVLNKYPVLIVNGEPAAFQVDVKKQNQMLKQVVLQAFQRLEKQYDYILVEGAGSPVEPNLKQNEFVNMGLATQLQAPVLLVSDIDRGGVFASLYGTVALLNSEERNLIKGIIINKFHGDPQSFFDGTQILQNLTKIPVLGILPSFDLEIEDEDIVFGNENIKTKERFACYGASYVSLLDQELDRLAQLFEKHLQISQFLF